MPKRKHSDHELDKLYIKLRKIEEELQRSKKKKRVRVLSSSSCSSSSRSSAQGSPTRQSEPRDCSPQNLDVEQEQTATISKSSDDLAINGTQEPAITPVADGDVPTVSAVEPPEVSTEPELDTDILEILGLDPSKAISFGKDIQKDVAVRYEHIATKGLTKEERKDLTDKYLIPNNCKLIGAPTLNPETKAALSEMVIKRDKVIESKQKLTATAISSLGQAISLVLSSKDKNTDLLRLLMDTGRTLCDCQHNDTVTRRNFIIFSVKKEMKESLQNAKVDSFLFGQDLTDTLKAARAINKSGAELKLPPPSKPLTSKKNFPTTSKNWKNTNPTRKQQTSTPKPKETTSSTMKNHRASSSKQSQSQRHSRH